MNAIRENASKNSMRKLGISLLAAILCLFVCLGSAAVCAYADEAEAQDVTEAPPGDENAGGSDEGSGGDGGADDGEAGSGDGAAGSEDSTDGEGTAPGDGPADGDAPDPAPGEPAKLPQGKPVQAGWMRDGDGSWYHFADVDASPTTGWLRSGGSWYYLDPAANGRMLTGLFSDGEASYVADSNGAMYASAWVQPESGGWYYAGPSGALATGWVQSGGAWYWLQADRQGKMASDAWVEDGGERYYLGAGGAMRTGWIGLDGGWYYAGPSGAQVRGGWICPYGAWYWLQAERDGLMAEGAWVEDGGERYYLGAGGAMRTGWIGLDDGWYYAGPSGAQVRGGWVASGGAWYWLQAERDGLMIKSATKSIDGSLYAFDGNGAMRASTTVDLGDDKVGYAASSGAIVEIGSREGGRLVLRDAAGEALTGWRQFGGAWFYGDEGGVAHTGWLELGGKRYWLDSDGVMATGLRNIDGSNYVFSASGAYVPVSAEHAATFERAVAELAGITNDSMTKEEKLWAAYVHVRDDFREYNPRIPHMKSLGWETIYADDIFIGRGGNCLSCAAAMAFLAKAAGYENVYACNSGGHGWAEVDGMVYDPEWARHNDGNYFARPYGQSGGPGYASAISDGIAWKRVYI